MLERKVEAMRKVAIVAAASRQETKMLDTEVEMMIPLISEVKDKTGLDQTDIGFTCSGSSDFLAGQAFSFVMTLDAVGPVPPISESHVEMDGAWALYEAWVKFQMGVIDTALVYSYGKPSPGSLQDVLSTQLDPYYVAPLWPDAHAVAGLQARSLLEQGVVTAELLADCALRTGTVDSREEYFSQPMLSDPLREADCPTYADGGVAVILASEEKAEELCEKPAWITGIDHRIDAHQFGVRDLTTVPSARIAAQKAGVHDGPIDVAELHAAYTTHDFLLRKEMGLPEIPTHSQRSYPIKADTLMASGLLRIAEAARGIWEGEANRSLAHATAGPLLQQNLVCVLSGERN
ncbi:MAG: lipid-transfer protein [Acidimicrobiales bacterium]|jgi:acetyl-CoA acetyltransferase|nr:lipid-transfer protein [Acidimicrobiales bacterium]MDP6297944.1 lipid-transfer protein [Acidimicrobiales bacterium]HJM27945.1 lipid-transfer protein [Acidimicrobiales bacterium]HJM98331.1 lipid-transfer protein [Acidimicrobiales bacterium]